MIWNETDVIKNTEKIVSCLSADLLKEEYRAENETNHLYGHCFVVTEFLFYIMGSGKTGWYPFNMDVDGISHWFVKNINNNHILDLTEGQFKKPINHSKGSKSDGVFFQKPSARCQVLMERMKITDSDLTYPVKTRNENIEYTNKILQNFL